MSLRPASKTRIHLCTDPKFHLRYHVDSAQIQTQKTILAKQFRRILNTGFHVIRANREPNRQKGHDCNEKSGVIQKVCVWTVARAAGACGLRLTAVC